MNSGNYPFYVYDSSKNFGYRDLVVVAVVMILKSVTGSFKMQKMPNCPIIIKVFLIIN